MHFDLQTILKKHFVSALIKKICGNDEPDIIDRGGNAYVFRRKEEPSQRLKRIIILPPLGYTANALNQTNSHDEALRATIEIVGGVKINSASFSKKRDCLLVAAFNRNCGISNLNKPYLTFRQEDLDPTENGTPGLVKEWHSAGEPPFAVVRENGDGFYHNLLNQSHDWLVLVLNKHLRPLKGVELESALTNVSEEQADILRGFYEGIKLWGDQLFNYRPAAVEWVVELPPEKSLPALREMLYVHDTGKHEACTVFATILKIGRRNPETVTAFLQKSIAEKTIPEYYAQQLMGKIGKQYIALSMPGIDLPQEKLPAPIAAVG